MKFTQRLVEKYGDSCLHFLACGWLTSAFYPFSWTGLLIGFMMSCIISYVKEKKLDIVFEKQDVYAGILGSATSIIIYIFIYVFKLIV